MAKPGAKPGRQFLPEHWLEVQAIHDWVEKLCASLNTCYTTIVLEVLILVHKPDPSRILHSGSKAPYKGDTKNHAFYRILVVLLV